jgi:tetratricopeptide (TPR) repeat protein
VIFLLLALTWGKTIDTKGLLGRWVGFGVLITMGIVQQFFGYVENYSLLFAVQLAYFIVGLRVLEGRIPLFYPTLLLGVLISLHLTGLMLIPSWILLWVETQKTWSRSKKLGIFALGMLGTLLLIGVAIQRVGTPGHLNRYALPFSDGLSEAPRYTLLSGAHLADLINLFSLAAPIGLPLFFLTFWFHTALKNEGPKVWFLLLAGSAQLYFLFLFNPMLGAGRDWDLLSATGTIAITLLLTLAIIRAPFAGRGYLSLVLVWTGFFSTATFVTLNASEKASVRRAENLALLDPLRDRGVSVGNVIEYYQERHRDQEEHQFDERALDRVESILEENPENAIAHLLRGSLLLSYKGNVAEAQKEALIALEKEPDLSLAWDVLATTYLAQRQPARAISCYEHRLTLNPDYAFAWDQLAMLYNMTGQLDQEIRCLEKLTLLTPDKIRVWGSLGLALEAKKDYSGAESAFRRAIRLKTREPMLHSDLGRNLLFQGKWAEAEEECRAAIRLDPKLAEAYGNLGAALVQMGRYAEAESILREGLTIAPDLPKLHINLCLALQRQGRNEEAEAEHEIYLKMEKEGKK